MNERVLEEPSRSGVFWFPQGGAAAAAREAGLKVLEADLSQFRDRPGVLNELGRAWDFPDWYGANLDALHDCLTDPDWQPATGYALVLSGLAKLQAANPDDFQALIEVLRSAADIRRADGTPFWVLLDSPAPGVPAIPDA